MTVRNPQLFHEAEVTDIAKFVVDGDWAMQQKVDGMRCLTVITPAGVEFYTRGGKLLNSSAAKLHFEVIRAAFDDMRLAFLQVNGDYEIVFDAEIMPDQSVLVVFDIPYARYGIVETIKPEDPFIKRYHHLVSMFRIGFDEHVTMVQTAIDLNDKDELVEKIKLMGGEGLVAKKLDSPYSEGDRVKHSLKLKFTSTADVVVIAKNSGASLHSIRGGEKINFVFGVLENGNVFEIGNCSGIGKEASNDPVEPGDVIEVEYLYVGAGGRLVQPRMLRKRPDKTILDCPASQLKHYSKAVL